jgi:hypothetical protein
VCGVDSIERQIQSNALWWGGREVYVAEKYMAELTSISIFLSLPSVMVKVMSCSRSWHGMDRRASVL